MIPLIADKGEQGPNLILMHSETGQHIVKVQEAPDSVSWCIWNQIEKTYWTDMATGDCLRFPTCAAAEGHVATFAAQMMETGEEFDPHIGECVPTEDS